MCTVFGMWLERSRTRCVLLTSAMTGQDQRDASIAMNLLEKKWLKLFSSAQQVKSTGSDRVKLVLQLLDMMYESEIRMNAIHVCVAVTVSFFFLFVCKTA